MKNQKVQLNKRLAGYSATAMALAAFTANAEGQVVYSGLKNIVVKNTSDSIDMDGDSIKDFRIINQISINWRSATLQILQSGNQWVGSNPYALNSGYFISSSRSFYSSSHPYNLGSYHIPVSQAYGNFPGAGDKFIGVRFLIGGSTHYGWIRINIPTSVDSITIKDWAYQKTAGYGLETGITGAPVLSVISIDKIGMDTATFNITSNLKSWLQYGVKLASDPAPTLEELFDGTDFVYNNGLDVSAGTPNNIKLTGLSPNVVYKVYASAIDNSADTSVINSINFTTTDTIPPVLSDISVDSIGGYTASVFVTSDEDGKIFYAVKLATESVPNAAEIKAGTGFIAAGNSVDTFGNAKQFDITGLANAIAYKVYFVAENLSGYTSVVRDTSFSTLDIVGPVLSDASVDNIHASYAIAHLTSSEKGTAYYAVKIASDATPSASEVEAGSGFVKAGNAAVDVATPHAFNITGLNGATAYSVYLVARDTSNNSSSVSKINFNTLDTIPPVLSAVSVDNILTTSAIAHITSSEKGTVYYGATSGGAVPSAADVKAGTGFEASGNADVDAATPHAFNILGLSSSTTYRLYLVAEDTSINLSAVAHVDFTTANNVGIGDIDKNNIIIYPNPANNVLYISLQEKSEYTIVDALGQMIQTGNLESGKSAVNISNLSRGIYFVHINFNNGSTFVQQIMKK